MTVGDLVSVLQDYDQNAEVRLAFQPRYPLEYSTEDASEVQLEDGTTVVYIAESRQLGYLPSEASRELGWKD